MDVTFGGYVIVQNFGPFDMSSWFCFIVNWTLVVVADLFMLFGFGGVA
jgi:hypothetical protein